MLVIMLLSAIYQPQNQFCIAVDGNADETFWRVINEVSDCYPNILVVILSGVDAPLKTNLEMVRILTALNGSFNTQIAPFERYRLRRKRVVQKQFRFLKGTYCADESLWGTIAGNPELLPMPGGFDGKDFLLRKYGGLIAR
ncbi:Core-2/I-Branching enzyme [Teladorsagia circumcincta]|uniref:Core-2/I-Branching enzyme n=1 Tax=Teladorsagia circumcincta TaxID=45464 RepID=A0A2G9UWZ4_TELCI|nr:Core-2/I-Branching enzyme [Teladorsagia circumcincta]